MTTRTKNILSVLVLIVAMLLIWQIMVDTKDEDAGTREPASRAGVIIYQEGDSTVFSTFLPDASEVKFYTENGDKVRITNLEPFGEVRSPLTVRGVAVGPWFFEASFPIRLIDRNGNEIAVTPAQAQGEWMTTEFVPFEATLIFDAPEAGGGYLILEKDNPSGLAEHAADYLFPVSFGERPVTQNDCVVTGCSGQICAAEEAFTTCQFLPEYQCYKTAICARQPNGECGWTKTAALNTCLAPHAR